MFKKTKVRSILELLGKNLSAREVSKVLGVSRNTVAEVQALFLQSGRSWDDISEWDDDRLYGLFYPDMGISHKVEKRISADYCINRYILRTYNVS